MVSGAAPMGKCDDETGSGQPPFSSPRLALMVMVRSWPLTVLAATDTEPSLTVVPGAVMLIAPPVRVKVAVVVPVVAALARPGRATSSRVAPTRAVKPARTALIDVPF